jgi:hypothetical protein
LLCSQLTTQVFIDYTGLLCWLRHSPAPDRPSDEEISYAHAAGGHIAAGATCETGPVAESATCEFGPVVESATPARPVPSPRRRGCHLRAYLSGSQCPSPSPSRHSWTPSSSPLRPSTVHHRAYLGAVSEPSFHPQFLCDLFSPGRNKKTIRSSQSERTHFFASERTHFGHFFQRILTL